MTGAAGYGKTTLLHQAQHGLGDWSRCIAACAEFEARIPFALVVQLLSRLKAIGDAQRVTSGADSQVRDPIEVGSHLVRVLGELQDSRPVAIVIDDIGYADPPSLHALSFALRRLETERILIIMSSRPDLLRRLPQSLYKLAFDTGQLVELEGLTVSEVRRLVAEAGGRSIASRAARRLVDHTAGSPLYLRSLIAELPTDEIATTSGPLPAPPSFGALVAETAASCSADARQLVEAAAIFGHPCPLTTVAAVGGINNPLVALEEAARSKLSSATHRNGEWLVGFPHPLIRSAVYDSLGPATRADLHRRAAATLPEEAALDHRIAAADGPDAGLVDALKRQAGVDRSRGQPARAADRLLAASQHATDGDDRHDLLTQAIDLLLIAGEVGEANGYAAQLAQLPPTPERLLVQAKLAWLSGQRSAEELARHVWIQCGISALGGGAAAMVAQCRVLADDGPGAAKWAGRALECPDLPADSAATARMNLATGLLISGRPEDALAFVADAPDTSDLPEARPQVWLRGEIRLWMDNLVGAHEDLGARPGESVAEAISPYGLMRLGFLAQVEYRLGRWPEALHHAEQAVSLVRDTDQVWLLAFAHAIAVYVFAGRGLWTQAHGHVQAAEVAAEKLGDQGSRDFAANAAIHLAHARGDHETVITRAQVLQSRPSIGVHDPAAFDWRRRYAAALVARDRHKDADHYLTELVAACERRKLPLVLCEVFGIHADLAAAQRRPDLARQRYEQALDLDPDGIAPFARARIHASYGRLLRRAGERRAATRHLLCAQDVFVRLDATPDLERCMAELAAVGIAVDEPKFQMDARLTPQERAVARLVCAGRTNREVASELVLSAKTVSYHLQNVYTKLGVNSRTQLAATLGSTSL